MKQRVADYIADFLANNGIKQVFSVVGGMAMHLNNAFEKSSNLNVLYNHHEQACTIAAESYSRIENKTAAVCVTSGPGGTNALTGVLCAYQDNLPMIVISGQVRSDTLIESTALHLRQFGEQEYSIIKSATPMTKYAVTITDANQIGYHLGKALYLTRTGRPGPCWIDVPLDIQGQVIDVSNLTLYTPLKQDMVDTAIINKIISKICKAERPIIIAGSAIRTSGAFNDFQKLIETINIPVVCPTSTVDLMIPSQKFYYGMFGVFGGRAGNFIIQNADLIVSFGARLSFKQIGFNYENFAPNAKKIVIDIDEQELKKPTIKVDMPVHANIKDIITALQISKLDIPKKTKWLNYCNYLKNKFIPLSLPARDSISAHSFSPIFFNKIKANAVVVLGNNCAAVSMLQSGIQKLGQRMYGNVNCGTMGYDLPAAIGASVACNREVFCVTGEGSFQMNLQELQTITHNNLPVKIIIFNNNSYQAIVNTQKNFFSGEFAGCNIDSGISFPNFTKLAKAYDFPVRTIEHAHEINGALDWLINLQGRAILELVQTEHDPIEPKLSSKKLDDGRMFSPPIDDMFPFLSQDEYKKCMYKEFDK